VAFSSVDKKHIATFFESLSFLIGCGYTAYDATYWVMEGSVKKDRESKAIKKICNALITDLSAGYTLSDAMERCGKTFVDYVKQIRAAEESGKTAEVLDHLSSSVRESLGLAKKIRSAMTYPITVLALTFGIAWYLFSFVIPGILETLSEVGSGETPPFTQMIMNLTDWMQKYAAVTLLIAVGGVVVLLFLARGPLKMVFHTLYTKMPVVSRVSLSNSVTTWMQSMRYMLMAGSPMADCLQSAADSINNRFYRHQATNAAIQYATAGTEVAQALKGCGFLTAVDLSTISIGLESGQTVELLERMETKKRKDTEDAINAAITMMNPIVICILGVIVGVIVFAVYGPLMNITQNIS